MSTRKPGLAFIACVCMVQLVTYTNGEVTPPWITLLGCFDAEMGSQTIPLSNNNPTNCFKACTTFNFVGMQKNTCICSKVFKAIADVQNVALRPHTKCSGQDNGFMFLYTKVSSLPNTINKDADYGHVYVNILSASTYQYHASKDSQERHNFICYDDSKQCKYRSYPIDRMNSEFAWSECNLVSYFDFVSCLNSTEFANGVFWIGMYRDSPDFSSTLSTLSTKASTFTSTSTSTTTPQLTTEAPTPLTITTTYTPSTTSLNVETVTRTASPLRTENINSTGNPNRTLTIGDAGNPSTTLTIGAAENTDRKWTIIAAAFIAISVALVIAIIGVLVAFLRKKKDNQISHTDQESMKRPVSSSMNHTDQKNKIRPGSVSTLSDPRGDHSSRDGENNQLETDTQSKISLPIPNNPNPVSGGNGEETLDKLSTNQESEKDKRRHRKSHHHREKHDNDLPDTVEGNSSENREKKRKRRKSHRREQLDANNRSDTAMENGQELHRKKRKHRKSDLNAETEVNDVSDMALEHLLLAKLDNDNLERKERRDRKKKKKKHANTLEEAD